MELSKLSARCLVNTSSKQSAVPISFMGFRWWLLRRDASIANIYVSVSVSPCLRFRRIARFTWFNYNCTAVERVDGASLRREVSLGSCFYLPQRATVNWELYIISFARWRNNLPCRRYRQHVTFRFWSPFYYFTFTTTTSQRLRCNVAVRYA